VPPENAQATLEADFDGPDESVINMESFGSALEKVDCTPPRLVLDFKDKSTYDAAKSKWAWVNEKSSHHFYMLVNHPACRRNIARVPYKITNVKYDPKKFVVYMDAEETDYRRMVHDGRIVMETGAEDDGSGGTAGAVGRRASADKEVSIKKDFSGNIFKVGEGNSSASLDCVDCGTEGQLKVKVDVSIKLLSIKRAFIEFSAKGVGAKLNLALAGKTSVSQKGDKELFSAMVVGAKVPGIGKLGLGPTMGVGYSAALTGDGKVTVGAGVTLSDPSVARVCLKGCDSTNSG
jgi:hypothetical protein